MQVWVYKGTLKTLSHQYFKCFFIFQSNTPFYAGSFELRYNKAFNAVGSDELNKPYIKDTKNYDERTLDIDDKTFQALLKWQDLQAEQLNLQNIEHQGDKQFIFLNNKNTFYINSNLNS